MISPATCRSPQSCRYCTRINITGHIRSHSTGCRHKIKKQVNCKSNNLIYCLQCHVCQKQYIGQTKRTIMERFSAHFYNIIKCKTNDNIGEHFNTYPHQGEPLFSISVLEFIHSPPNSEDTTNFRLKRESHWIHLLRTTSPQASTLWTPPHGNPYSTLASLSI